MAKYRCKIKQFYPAQKIVLSAVRSFPLIYSVYKLQSFNVIASVPCYWPGGMWVLVVTDVHLSKPDE